MKVAIPGGDYYFYPDVFITEEKETTENRYIQYQPELIAEVVNESTRTKDIVDKFIQYRKIESLQYYIVAEPLKCLVQCYFKQNDGEWGLETYTLKEEIIPLPKLNIQLPLSVVYNA